VVSSSAALGDMCSTASYAAPRFRPTYAVHALACSPFPSQKRIGRIGRGGAKNSKIKVNKEEKRKKKKEERKSLI